MALGLRGLVDALKLRRAASDDANAMREELDAQGDDLRAVKAELAQLVNELRARPYNERPDVFETTDKAGQRQIGFRGIEAPRRDGYVGFEDIFRGSEDLVRDRQRGYVDLVREHEPVLDIGCGRGEFLDLLAEAGISGAGVDANSDMVELCRAKGHAVERNDAIAYLATRSDASLGAVFCAQVIEHLDYGALERLFSLARRKLAPNGVFIAETVNPHCIQAMQGFWVDPTHIRPIPPDAVVALCWLHGFADAVVMFPTGTRDLARDLYAAGEYAVVAHAPED